jgi:hypothetical protein
MPTEAGPLSISWDKESPGVLGAEAEVWNCQLEASTI